MCGYIRHCTIHKLAEARVGRRHRANCRRGTRSRARGLAEPSHSVRGSFCTCQRTRVRRAAPAITPARASQHALRMKASCLNARATCWHVLRQTRYLGGKPIIRGHRLAVEHVLGMLAAGDTPDELLASSIRGWSRTMSEPARVHPPTRWARTRPTRRGPSRA